MITLDYILTWSALFVFTTGYTHPPADAFRRPGCQAFHCHDPYLVGVFPSREAESRRGLLGLDGALCPFTFSIRALTRSPWRDSLGLDFSAPPALTLLNILA